MFFEIPQEAPSAQIITVPSELELLSREMQKIDKTELHLHLGGSWPLDYLESIAEPSQFLSLSKLLAQFKEEEIDYHQGFSVFGLIAKIVNTDKKVEDGTAALCKRLAQDGVSYAEIRTGLKDLDSGLEGYLNAVLRGLERGKAGTRLAVDIVLSLRRDSSELVAKQTLSLLKKYYHQGIVGLDLSGDSLEGDEKGVFSILVQAHKEGIPLTLHIGESPKETEAQQMSELLNYQPQRVGHCVHLCPQALAWILNNKTPVELCLTSALYVKMLSEAGHHPALQLLKQEHPVAICTDDPLIFEPLSKECAKIAHLMNFSIDDMIKLQKKTMTYRFGHNNILY